MFDFLIQYCSEKENFDPDILYILQKQYMEMHLVVYPLFDADQSDV